MSIILIRGVWLRKVISWAGGEWLPGPPNSPQEKKGHLWVFKALKETFRVSKPDEGKCSWLALGLFLVQAAGTKSNKLSGLNNKAYISCSYGNWKSKIKVDLILGEILFLAYQVAPSYCVLFGRDRGEREGKKERSDVTSSSCKGTNHIIGALPSCLYWT